VIGFAEHDVIGISFAREHGIMTAVQTAGADDAARLERGERRAQGLDSGEMCAVGAHPRHDFGAAVDKKRNVAALNDRRHVFGAIDRRALVGLGEAQEDRRDVARGKCCLKVARNGGGVVQYGGDEV
jgi:hypothetical protein